MRSLTAWFKPRRVRQWPWGLLLWCFAQPALAEQLVIVVPANGKLATLTREQVADIWLGRALSLPGGGIPKPVDQPESSPLREEFYSRLTGKSAAQAKSYWARRAFTGKGLPPREATGTPDIKKILAADPGAVAYIEKSALDSSVRAVLELN